MGDNAWRWMLGGEAVPALVDTVMCFSIPQSPRWLIGQQGNREAGVMVLKQLNPAATDAETTALVNAIIKASQADYGSSNTAARFLTLRLRVPMLVAFLVAFFNQLSGINAILYFAPRIFELAGLGKNAALLNSISVGVTNLVSTFAGLYLIDRIRCRTLLHIGSFGYIASLDACAGAFLTFATPFQVANTAISVSSLAASLEKAESLKVGNETDIQQLTAQVDQAKQSLVSASILPAYAGEPVKFAEAGSIEHTIAAADTTMQQASEKSGFGGTLVMQCIFAFIAAHAVGQGAVIWVLISEVFPNQHRATGQSLGSFTHWIFAALLTTLSTWMISTFAPASVFGFFCGMMVLQLVWVAIRVPETTGVPPKKMEKKLLASSTS